MGMGIGAGSIFRSDPPARIALFEWQLRSCLRMILGRTFREFSEFLGHTDIAGALGLKIFRNTAFWGAAGHRQPDALTRLCQVLFQPRLQRLAIDRTGTLSDQLTLVE